jgi:hypothetical protein
MRRHGKRCITGTSASARSRRSGARAVRVCGWLEEVRGGKPGGRGSQARPPVFGSQASHACLRSGPKDRPSRARVSCAWSYFRLKFCVPNVLAHSLPSFPSFPPSLLPSFASLLLRSTRFVGLRPPQFAFPRPRSPLAPRFPSLSSLARPGQTLTVLGGETGAHPGRRRGR